MPIGVEYVHVVFESDVHSGTYLSFEDRRDYTAPLLLRGHALDDDVVPRRKCQLCGVFVPGNRVRLPGSRNRPGHLTIAHVQWIDQRNGAVFGVLEEVLFRPKVNDTTGRDLQT